MIVIIDDNLITGKQLYKLICSKTNLKIILFERAAEGIRFIMENDVTAVFTDIQMLGMSGLDVIRIIKVFSASLPVIVITSDSSESMIKSIVSAGAYKVFMKPIKEKLLYTVLRELDLIE